MTSEGTKTLILTFTSKLVQPVERTRHRIFNLEFLSEGGYIKAFYRPDIRLQTLRVHEI